MWSCLFNAHLQSVVCSRLNNNEAAGFFPGGQLEEVTDPADVSDSDRPALHARGFGQVQFLEQTLLGGS